MMQLSGKTHLYAILAHPVAHVRAPEFFNPYFDERGIDAFIVPLHVLPEDFGEVVRSLTRLRNLHGLVLTIPHKEAMAKLCDELGPDGRLVGAVNAVRFAPGGRLIGDMFDGIGLVRAATANGFVITGKRVLLIGTGGAGRAIAFAIARQEPALLRLANRTAVRAEGLVADLCARVPGARVEFGAPDPTGFELIINATSLGLHEADALPLDPDLLRPEMAVIDIIASPEVTALRRAAADIGCPTMGGRPMVDHQLDSMLKFFGEQPA
jgi:shikimate dehydrogenase